MAAEEVNELLLAHGLHLARLDGLGGDLVLHIGQHSAQAHHVARTGNLQNHRFAVARGGRDLHLPEADDEHVARLIALGKQLGAAGMAHHNANLIVVGECIRSEIAEHAQMAMLAIQTIFRRVMGLNGGHTITVGN